MWNRNVGLGIFVVLGTALFALAIFLIGNQHNVFAKHLELYTVIKDLNGLAKGAQVQVAGFDAGEVTDISLPKWPSTGFRLKLRLDARVRDLIRTDSVATIATEGVVGDKFLLIAPGSATAPEATPFTTLASKETGDMAELIQKSTTLVDNASGNIKIVADKLNAALDAATTTINNVNDLAVGLQQGRGAAGMLLSDEKTAADIRQAIDDVHRAASSLNHASGQADALISDFQSRGLPGKVDGIISDLQSRNFGEKIDQTMENVHSAARNVDATTEQLQQTLAKVLAPDAQGLDAADKIRQTLSNVNEASANMADGTEALKHGFLFRGFFKHRGYYSLARLTPDRYRQDKVFTNPKNARVWIEAAELFALKQGEGEMLSREGRARIDAAVGQFGDGVIGGAMVVEGYAASSAPGDQLAVSRDRAILVGNYLRTRFELDDQNVGTIPLRGIPPAATHKDSWNGVCIVLLTRSSENT